MSGIYIPGAEKPNSCYDCELNIYGFCTRLKRYVVDSAFVDAKCPILPIPDHGRLGDLDALAECIRTEGKNQAEQLADRHHPVVMAYGDCYGKCKAAPTIVPTDKEADI